MKSRLSKGQAEIIGGLIVVSTLLLIVIPLVINLMTTSTTITTRGYTIRSQFEISRWSEKLISNKTHIINPSSVDIEIVRIWLKDGTLKEFNPWIKIPITSSKPIEVLEITDISEIDSIVTSRGRVFKLEELIPPQITIPIQYPPLGINPTDIIAGSYLIQKNHNITVRCQYDGKPCSDPVAGFYYNYSKTWYKNNGTGWEEWVNASNEINSGEERYTNLDENYANELVVLTKSNNKYIVVNGKELILNITFYDVTEIDSNKSLVVVYLKVLVLNPEKAPDTSIEVTVSLINSTDNSKQISSYATFSSAQVGGVAGSMLVIYEGYAMFPLTQFGIFNNTLGSSRSWFNVNIYLSGRTNMGSIYMSMEYISIITY